MTEIDLQEAYDVRPIRFLELWRELGWALKVYGIAYRSERPREELVEASKEIARERVANSMNNDNHYGVGFLGMHDGRGANFESSHSRETLGLRLCWPTRLART